MTPVDEPPIGLIAGFGRPPFLVAEGIRRAGRKLFVAGFRGLASPRLMDLADDAAYVGIARLGRLIAALRKRRVTEAVMMGGVRKTEIYSRLRIIRYMPDLRTMRLWYRTIRKDKRDNAVLIATANELKREGITLVNCVKYCSEHLADEGLMTHTPLKGEAQADVEFGWRIAKASAEMDIGQSIAVKERDIIAVEAMEGTDAMIRRTGELCRVGGWTLVKVARPDQDMRFDVPTIGPNTLKNLRAARCSCVVVEAARTLIVDKPVTLALADKLKIALVGMKSDPAKPGHQAL